MWISDQCFLSRRDRVIVAWQFTARDDVREDPSRRVRCDGGYRWPSIWRMCLGPVKNLYSISRLVTVQTVPDGTDLFRTLSLAVNCQATITRSLRDKTADGPERGT